MAHYAILDENNIVIKVITGVDESETIDGKTPEVWYGERYEKTCKRTGKYDDYRKNYAGLGYSYDATRDAFIPPQPYPSWTLNETTCLWEPPLAMPNDDNMYQWNEETQSWDQVTES